MLTKLAVSSHLKKLRMEDQSNKYTVSIASLNLRIHYTYICFPDEKDNSS